MSNEVTNPVLKWILIAVIAVSLCAVGAFVSLMTYPAEEYRAVKELESRGFKVRYELQGNKIWQYPILVIGEDRSITEDDSQLLCHLPRLMDLVFRRCDLSELNLDNIGTCRKLDCFQCNDVTQFPADEINKLAACPLKRLILKNACVNDSNLKDFAKWKTVDYIDLDNNAGITDDGFEHFEKIPSLKRLELQKTSVTIHGVTKFKKKRPDVTVQF